MIRILCLWSMLCLFACQYQQEPITPIADNGTAKYYLNSQKPFYHGVASGDPLTDRVIIWTRVTPEHHRPIKGKWSIASDAEMNMIIQTGSFQTDSTKDYTVKVDVTNLQAGTSYYYQFEVLGKQSMIGKTKTLTAQNVKTAKFAVVSCSNFEAGYFNAFARIAEQTDLDAVLHLGDYIYEYGLGEYGDTTLGRLNLPVGEIITLSDYRTRYALYRLDRDFQKAHQNHPFITIWDDHEITNNAYKEGGQNHQKEEGDYQTRKNAAQQVYYEWLPVRESPHLYRSFQFGDLVNLIMLDERLIGRTAPVDSISQAGFLDSTRTILGETQRNWFFEQLKTPTTWQVIGNQVMFSALFFGDNWYTEVNLDAWDGYPYEQQLIKTHLIENNIKNTIFVTGDTHSSWALETVLSRDKNLTSLVAIEFGTTSISSSNSDEIHPIDTVKKMEKGLKDLNPHLKYVDLRNHGYLLLSLTQNEATAEWMYVHTVSEPSEKEYLGKKVVFKNGGQQLIL